MKKNFFLGLLAIITTMVIFGCTEKENKINTFAIDFGTKASKNYLDSVKMLYPSLDTDSVSLKLSIDSISIVEGSEPNTFIINYGNGVIVNVSQTEDGNISATSSKGIYAFKAEDLDFAKSTGMYDASLDDKTLKTRFAEIPYVKEFAKKKFEASNKKDLSVTSSVTGPSAGYASIRTLHIKIKNTGNVPVKGSDYSVKYSCAWMDFGQPMSRKFTVPGKDVPVGNSITINEQIIGMGGVTGIVWKNKNAAEDFDNEYKPTGKEYEEYIASKNNEEAGK